MPPRCLPRIRSVAGFDPAEPRSLILVLALRLSRRVLAARSALRRQYVLHRLTLRALALL